jgi:hypothetical protein
MKKRTGYWKFPTILCVLVVAVWSVYWTIAMCAFKGDLTKAGQFGDTFGGLNTLFTGLAFAVVLATLIQQWQQIREIKRDAREERRFRLRLDLYERRFRIYQTVADFIGGCTCDNVGQQEMIQFDTARREAFFLFAGDADLLNYLAEIRQKAGELAIAKSQAKVQAHLGSPASKDRDAIRDWFQAQLNAVNDRFVPHLSFAYPVPESAEE